MDDVANPIDPNIMVYHLLPYLKPYTQYAFYVKTYTIATEQSGAQSQISYFRTKPDGKLQILTSVLILIPMILHFSS